MVDNAPAPAAPALANFAPGMVAALSAEQRTAFSAQLKSKGFDPAKVDLALAAPAGAAPGASKAPAATEAPVVGADGLTPAQRTAAIENLRRFYTGGDLDAALKAQGVIAETPAADNRTDAEKSFDASTLAAAKPEAISLNWSGRGDIDPASIVARDTIFRTELSAASVPAALAQSVTEALLDASERYIRLGDAERKLNWAEQKAILARTGDVDRILALAKLPLTKMSQDFRTKLAKSGALESAQTVRLLANVGELIQAREAMRKK